MKPQEKTTTQLLAAKLKEFALEALVIVSFCAGPVLLLMSGLMLSPGPVLDIAGENMRSLYTQNVIVLLVVGLLCTACALYIIRLRATQNQKLACMELHYVERYGSLEQIQQWHESGDYFWGEPVPSDSRKENALTYLQQDRAHKYPRNMHENVRSH